MALKHLVAAIAGAATAWTVVPSPLGAVASPTRVAWDATTCPAGVYTVTATARGLGDGASYEVTSSSVRLPRPSFVQEFPNLPAGTYVVTARTSRGDGPAFGSDAQLVTNFVGFGTSGHQRAVPGAQGGAAAAPGARAAASTTSRVPDEPPAVPLFDADAVRRLLGVGGDWRRFEAVDTDADGLIDLVAIERVNGDVWVWHSTDGRTFSSATILASGGRRER